MEHTTQKVSLLWEALFVIVGHDRYLKRSRQISSDSHRQKRVLAIELSSNLVRMGVILGLPRAVNHISCALTATRGELSGAKFWPGWAL